MEDVIYDPLERYKSVYRDAFHKNAVETFDALAQKAGIDKEKNKALCAEIENISSSRDKLSGSRKFFSVLRILACICAALLFAGPLLFECSEKAPACWGGSGVLLVCIFALLGPKIRKLDEEISNFDYQIQKKKEEALEQMEPLNALFYWDIPPRLIEKTVPKLHFDTFFTESRLAELQSDFGYDGSFNEDASVLFSISGEISGNPFVVANTKNFQMGEKIYTGYRTIHWSETVIGSDGKRHRVLRSQTLSASVTKPCPVYTKLAFVLYGNDAAPHLCFTRKPSHLVEEGFLQNFRRKRKLRELKKFSRNLKDSSQYTLMGNEEFETLFETKDRNDEVEYRLLFTALAQRQMLSLLKERDDAYGDDFTFVKDKKINVIIPGHLNNFDLNTDPANFMHYDYEKARRNFIQANREYFRAVYFSMAPLLSIPLYQQMRSQKTLYGENAGRSSFWEWESIANFYGEERFRHPKCATECILKTRKKDFTPDGKSRIDVTAYGYASTRRIDYVPVPGGDGRLHNVPVEWDEYSPVERTSEIRIDEAPVPDMELLKKRISERKCGEIYRRGIFSVFR